MCSVRSAGTPAGRLIVLGHIDRGELIGAGDALLHLADAGQILVELALVVAAEPAIEVLASSRTASSTLARISLRATVSGSACPPPKSRSKTSLGLTSVGNGVVALRQDKRVFVDAGIAAVAVAGAAVPIDGHFQRAEAGAVAQAGRGDLVGGYAGLEIGAGRFLRLGAREESAAGPGVVAAAVAVGVGLVASEAAEDDHVLAVLGQGLQAGRHRVIRALSRGHPVGHPRAQGEHDEGHAAGEAGLPQAAPSAVAGSIASKSGSATAVPRPRNTVRLEIRVDFIGFLLSSSFGTGHSSRFPK